MNRLDASVAPSHTLVGAHFARAHARMDACKRAHVRAREAETREGTAMGQWMSRGAPGRAR
eukprot:2906675-Pleurochrysis_carterae.AAC.1